MVKRVTIFILFIFSLSVFAESARGKLECPSRELKAGRFEKCQLTLWPFPKDREQVLSGLQGQKIANSLNIYKVLKVFRSENNVDAILIDLELIPSETKKLEDFYVLKLGQEEIPIEILADEIRQTKELKDYFIFDLKVFSKENILFWIIAALIVLLIAITFFIYFFKKRLAKRKTLEKKVDVKALILNAETRKDFEKIYLYRKDLDKTDNGERLLSYINELQYRKDWSADNFDKLRDLKNSWTEGQEQGGGK